MNKKKLTRKQKETIKKRKVQKQIDSNNLRAIVKAKREWTINEIKRGKKQIQETTVTLYKLQGILAFINDLVEPIKEDEK